MENYELLWEILGKHGPSGDEKEVSDFLANEAIKYCDDVSADVLGNLIAHKKGKGEKVMFSAHMDSIGFLVTHIEEEGFLRVGRFGGVDPKEVLNAPVRFKNGTRGIVVKDEKVAFNKLTINDIAIDIGAKSREEAEKKVLLGDSAVVCLAPQKFENEEVSVTSPYLDNRIACYILLEAMKELKNSSHENDLYFVFSVQEEVGLRGAKTAAYSIDPAYGLAVDVTDVMDSPGSEKGGTCKLGEGAGVKIMDRSVISHPDVVAKLEELATENNIKQQRDILKAGGTDAGVIHVSRSGVKTGGISVPCRYVHCPNEMVNMSDVRACVDLTVAFSKAKLPPIK